MSLRTLKTICYVSRQESKDTDISGNEISVKHTFPYNPSSKTAPETALRWGRTSTYDYATKKYIDSPEPVPVERPNDPFQVTLIDLDIRGRGGRAYKVIDQDSRCFDLREDQLMEVFKHTGILPGGKIPGTFTWVIDEVVKLALVDGDLHKKVIEEERKLEKLRHDQSTGAAPSAATLVAGKVYKKRDESLWLFLGRVHRPGSNALNYALIEMPNRPYMHDDLSVFGDADSPTARHYARENEVAKKWDSMSWEERVDWAWRGQSQYQYEMYPQDRYPNVVPGYYDHYSDIVMTTSVNFESEVSDATSLAESIKQNVDQKHKYIDGKKNNIPESIASGRPTPYWSAGRSDYQHDWRLSREENYKREAKRNEHLKSVADARSLEFKQQLRWV